MRLIDADALFSGWDHKLSEAVKYGNRDATQQAFSYSTMMMYEIADEIDDAPTINAVPVVRGGWVSVLDIFVCSACDVSQPYAPKFCPNCGADMRGE